MIEEGRSFLKIGHRGAAGYAPENTLASFTKAIKLGVDVVELDVYVCKTGEIVVIHDDKVDRTTDGKGYVFNKNYDELRLLNTGNGEKIPLLEEVLDLMDKKVVVNIELKGPDTAKPVYNIIKKYVKEKKWNESLFMISSFDRKQLKTFRKLNPKIKIGILVGEKTDYNYKKFAKEINAYSINPSMKIISQNLVDDIHKEGMKVLVWTANDGDIKAMKNLGADGIFSDFPDRL